MENTTFSGFGDLLKAWRKRRGLTQKNLAALLGVHRNTIGTWENGDFLPESKTIVLELARQLRLDNEETRRLLEASLTALSPYWHVPYQRNPFFTGREDVLHRLHEALAQEQSVTLSQSYALSGLGGIGKTQTAIEYAYRYVNEYTAVFWITVETVETILSGMLTIAHLLNLPEKQEQEQEKIVTAVLQWFSGHRDWLLIFDNIEDPALMKRFLPSARHGSLIFTTRRQSLGFATQTLTLEKIPTAEGVQLLLHRARIQDANLSLEQLSPTQLSLAQEIVSTMDGLPLALDQVGAYIEATQCSLSDYLQLFQASQGRLLDEREAYADHPLSVTKTFALVFKQLEKSDPAAAEMLTVCTYLAAEAIPESIFINGASLLGPNFEQMAADPFAFQAALKTLLTYSLVQRNTLDATITIHRLVQAVLRDFLSETMQHLWLARVLRTLAHLFPINADRQSDYWQLCEKLLPHALICISLSEQWSQDATLQTPLITLMNYVARYLSHRGRYKEGETLFQKALEIGEQQTGSDQIPLADTLHLLADHYRRQSMYEQAEQTFQRALQIRETLGVEHPRVAGTLATLAILYVNQGRYQEAEPLYQRALQITEKNFGPEHSDIVSYLNNLGILYQEQGRYSEVEPLYQRILRVWEKTLGPENPRIAYPLNNLANSYREQGKYEQAEPLYQRALSILEHALGPEYLEVSYPLNNLATLYREQGKYELAKPLYQRALQIRQQDLKPGHSLIADPIFGLAKIALSQKEYPEAEQLYQRAFQIWEQALGSDNSFIALPLTGLAMLAVAQGRYEEAERLHQRALTLRQQHLRAEHPEVAETFHELARLRTLQHRIPEALSLYQQALAMREKALGKDHHHTRATRTAYASLLSEAGQIDHTEPSSPSPDQETPTANRIQT